MVYEKDLGPESLNKFREMALFSRDKSWILVIEQDQWESRENPQRFFNFLDR